MVAKIKEIFSRLGRLLTFETWALYYFVVPMLFGYFGDRLMFTLSILAINAVYVLVFVCKYARGFDIRETAIAIMWMQEPYDEVDKDFGYGALPAVLVGCIPVLNIASWAAVAVWAAVHKLTVAHRNALQARYRR